MINVLWSPDDQYFWSCFCLLQRIIAWVQNFDFLPMNFHIPWQLVNNLLFPDFLVTGKRFLIFPEVSIFPGLNEPSLSFHSKNPVSSLLGRNISVTDKTLKSVDKDEIQNTKPALQQHSQTGVLTWQCGWWLGTCVLTWQWRTGDCRCLHSGWWLGTCVLTLDDGWVHVY